MASLLVKPMALGLVIGVLAGVVGLVGLSSVLGYELFGIEWRNPKTYYLKVGLYYIYLHTYSASSNIPVIGNKTLLEYLVIVRVENPYEDTTVVPNMVSVSLFSDLKIAEGTENTTAAPTVTVTVTIPPPRHAPPSPVDVFFDAWREKKTVSYMGVNNILWDGGRIYIDRETVNNWLYGGDKIGNHKYYVLSGIVEFPSVWMNALRGNTTWFYAVVEVSGKTLNNDLVEGQLIQLVYLNRVDTNTYVYNNIPWSSGFELSGSQYIETFYGEIWP